MYMCVCVFIKSFLFCVCVGGGRNKDAYIVVNSIRRSDPIPCVLGICACTCACGLLITGDELGVLL